MTDPEVADANAERELQSRCSAWTKQRLRQVYGHCLSLHTCGTEFGVTWRFQVPETKRPLKVEGVCLCSRFYGSPVTLKEGGPVVASIAVIRHSLVEREEEDELSP